MNEYYWMSWLLNHTLCIKREHISTSQLYVLVKGKENLNAVWCHGNELLPA